MSYQVSKDGIEILTASEVANNIINGTEFSQGMKDIYGQDTNFDQDSPDAQLVNIFAQCVRDISELIVQVFDSFDPDQASGSVLDSRVLYNGVIRKAGSYTQEGITIVADREVTLKGIDQLTDDEIPDSNVFTVQDYIGNKYYLFKTTTLPVGTNSGVVFRAQYMGETLSVLNSINEIVTPQRGVISVNNPQPPLQIGVAEETDEQLKLRRARAVGLGMLGSVEVLQASLRQLTDVTDACVFENRTDFTDEDGIPPHSIWVIVRGGNNIDIANVIFLRLNAGCGMKGDTVIPVANVYNDKVNIAFDVAQKENLSIRLHVEPINGVDVIDPQVLADSIAYNYRFNIYEPATATRVDSVCKQFSNNFSYSQIELSADPNTRGSLKTTATLDLTNWSGDENGNGAVNYGCLNVTLDGTNTVQINGMDFTGVQSFVAVANIITEAFAKAGYGAYAEADSDSITLFSKTRGSDSKIRINQISGGYTDLSGSSFLDVDNMTKTVGSDATRGYIVCNTIDSTLLTALKNITDGSFGININETLPVQISGLDFSDCESADDVATVINSAFALTAGLGASCDSESLNVYIYSNLYGAGSSVEIEAGQTGTNLVNASLLIDPSAVPVAGVAGTNGTATTNGFTLTNWEAVSNGAIAVKVNGGNTKSVGELDFRACDSITKVATLLNSVFVTNRILATVSASNGELVFTSNIAGANSKVDFEAYTGSFQDLYSIDYLDGATMAETDGVSPNELSWTTLIYPEYKKNYFEIDSSYITVTVDE